ncbi:MAG: SusC/RagA family TonB-linked outer membrane protein [Bacteroidota bacterium]
MRRLTNCRKYVSKACCLVLLLFIIPGALISQKLVTGKVTDSKTAASLAGVAVREKGTTKGVSTDDDGNFSITVKSDKSVLLISYVGYNEKQITVGSATDLSGITLEQDEKALDDVVITVGYQNVKRRTNTAAVGSVRGKDIENTPYASFDQMLQGRVAGLTVLSTSGEPGANNIVNIRGTTSLTEGGVSTPLYVIDGIVYDVNDMPTTYGNSNPLTGINPNDIESIDVLKDASASAIYGARAANGVILVRTKKPKSGKPQFRVSAYSGISDRPALKPVVVGALERRLKMDLLRAGGDYSNISNGAINLFLTDSLNPAFNNNVDWQGLFLQKAMVTNFDASIAAAEEKYAYRVSFNYYNEEGVMKGYGLTRMSPRLFLMMKPAKNVQVTNNVFMSFGEALHGSGDGGRYPFSAWGFPSSFWALSTSDMLSYTGRLDANRDDDRSNSINGNTKVEVTLLPGLSVSSTFDYNFNFNRRDWLYSSAVNGSGLSQGINNNINTRRWELTNLVTYVKSINDHSFTALVGQASESQTNNYSYISGTGVPIESIKTIVGVPSGPNLYANSGIDERSRLSWFGRVSYNYKSKYILDLNFRADASSRYGKENRWGQFPAISGGWIISDEDAFKPLKSVVSFLKFRGSYGITGIDPGSYYAQYQTLVNTANYYNSRLGINYGDITTYNGTTVTYPNYTTTAADKAISWEQSPQYNVGADLGLFKDRINITADWYVRDSKEKVFDVAVPVTTGYTLVSSNFVNLRNTGVEVSVNANMLPRNWKLKWNLNANAAFNKNYITKLPDGGRDFYYGPPWMQRSLSVGQPLFSFQVWQVDGVYANQSDVPVDPLTGNRMRWDNANGPFFGAGDPARRDMNGDYIINSLDKVSMGNPNPDVVGGLSNTFTYKGLSLDVLCTFITGRSLWNGYLSDRLQDAGTSNPYFVWGGSAGPAMDFNGRTFWQQPGDVSTYPALITNTVDKWHIGQSMFVEDASFFRMKRVSLSYGLPEKLIKRLKFSQFRFFGMLDNVFVLSNATVPDPEAVEPNGYSGGNDYPIPKKFTLGIDLSF